MTEINEQPRASRLYAQRGGVSNWLTHFATEKEIWVQNCSDMQISLDIEIAPGQSDGKLLPPTPDPVCLTEKFTFKQLKESAKFKQMLSRRKEGRSILIILTEEQVEKYFEAKARMMGAFHPDGEADIGAALEKAQQTVRELTTMPTSDEDGINAPFSPPKSAMELMHMETSKRGLVNEGGRLVSTRRQAGAPGTGDDGMYMEEVVKPRVLHLCNQASPHGNQGQQITEDQLWASLEPMTMSLKADDFQHIQSHGYFRRIKTWARQQLARLAEGEAPMGMSLTGHAQVAAAERAPIGVAAQGQPQRGAPEVEYQGPGGFVNGPTPAMHPPEQQLLGPDGAPL